MELMKKMEAALRDEAYRLRTLKDELDRLKSWLMENEKRLYSAARSDFYYYLLSIFETKRKEFNQKVATYNRLVQRHKEHLNEFQRVKSQVEALQKGQSDIDDHLSKTLYQPPFQIVLADGEKHRVAKVSISQKHDLALLKFDGHISVHFWKSVILPVYPREKRCSLLGVHLASVTL